LSSSSSSSSSSGSCRRRTSGATDRSEGSESRHSGCVLLMSNVRPVRLGKRRHSQCPGGRNYSSNRSAFHHRTAAKGSKVSKMGRIDFRHQG
jgi:hypothetical protein